MPPTKIDLIYEQRHGEHPIVELRLSLRFRRMFLWLMLVSAMIGHCALASEVLLLTRSNSGGAVDQVLRASRFYGLDVQIRAIDGSSNSKKIMRTLKYSNALAVIVSEDVLDVIDRATTLKALSRANMSRIPLLIVATGKPSTSHVLSDWSDGRIQYCKPIESHADQWQMIF